MAAEHTLRYWKIVFAISGMSCAKKVLFSPCFTSDGWIWVRFKIIEASAVDFFAYPLGDPLVTRYYTRYIQTDLECDMLLGLWVSLKTTVKFLEVRRSPGVFGSVGMWTKHHGTVNWWDHLQASNFGVRPSALPMGLWWPERFAPGFCKPPVRPCSIRAWP